MSDDSQHAPIGVEPPPRDESDVRERHAGNRAGWNEGALHYTAEIDETVAYLLAGGSNLHPVERRNLARLGDLRSWCGTAIHLQCASGRDTLSLWNEGVPHVVGVDISDVHIENARKITAALQAAGKPVSADWHRCDVLDTPHALDGTADMVYTGRGAICWIMDLQAYAAVIARLLKPGGVYHILDDHPVTFFFDLETDRFDYNGTSYFGHYEASKGWPSTYIGDSLNIPVEKQAVKHEAMYNFMAIFSALRGAGLVIEYLGEHPEPYWDIFPNLKPELQGRLPLTFSMLARKPE